MKKGDGFRSCPLFLFYQPCFYGIFILTVYEPEEARYFSCVIFSSPSVSRGVPGKRISAVLLQGTVKCHCTISGEPSSLFHSETILPLMESKEHSAWENSLQKQGPRIKYLNGVVPDFSGQERIPQRYSKNQSPTAP